MSETVKESERFINLGVVLNRNGEVLMIRRKEEERGSDGAVLRWAFPGGKQRSDESRERSVEREVLAETGYAVKSLRQISMRIHPQFLVMVVYHLCELASPKQVAEPSEPHEVADIQWVKPEDVPQRITTDLDPDVRGALGL